MNIITIYIGTVYFITVIDLDLASSPGHRSVWPGDEANLDHVLCVCARQLGRHL